MSDQTTRLQLPFLASGQAQKHVTVNESLLRLDALVQLSAVSATTATQPGSPADGQIYILPSGKTGADWGAMANGALAYYRDGVWEQLVPREGWLAQIADADQVLIYSGTAWVGLASALRISATDRLLGRVSSGAGAAEEVTFTDQAQALCDDASFDEMCATLGTWRVLARSAVAASVTGSTSETTLASVTIPANAMGANGVLRISAEWSYTNSANNKTLRTRLGGLSGAVFDTIVPTTNAYQRRQCEIKNRNAANVQLGPPSGFAGGGWGTATNAVATGALDTTVAQTLVLSGQLASAGETITLQSYLVELCRGA